MVIVEVREMEKRFMIGSIALMTIFIAGALAGCLGEDKDEVEGEIITLNFKIDISGSEDNLEIEVISGSGEWADYMILVDGATILTTTASDFSAGDDVIFTDPASIWDPISWTEYNVKIVDIGDDKVVYESDIIAKA